jgi:hypothetical protein
MEWFECKVSYEKENEDGKIKKTTESYLVKAVSFTEAEAVVTKEVYELIGGEFNVEAVKKEKISEIFRSESGEGIWVKVKVAYITVDEISGKEKRTNVTMYQQSGDMFKVGSDLKLNLKDSVVDWEIKSAVETKILEVFENEIKN